jgi:hypothetical protein
MVYWQEYDGFYRIGNTVFPPVFLSSPEEMGLGYINTLPWICRLPKLFIVRG